MAPPGRQPWASPTATTTSSTSSLLGSFRTAVRKVRFLLSFSATRWILSSIVGSRAGVVPRRRVSFGGAARPPSLLDFEGSVVVSPVSGAPSRSSSLGPLQPPRTVSRTSSAASSELLFRTASGGSSPGGDDDINQRAEQFIANFYKHIQMERQVSLQLRYLERTPSG